MQTPEEFEWTLYQAMDHQMDAWKNVEKVHELIRARDAEVRAEAVADFERRLSVAEKQMKDSATVLRRLMGPWHR